MDWRGWVALAALLVTSMLTGGAIVRVGHLLDHPRAAAVVGLLAVLIAGVTGAAVRSRRWRSSPYW